MGYYKKMYLIKSARGREKRSRAALVLAESAMFAARDPRLEDLSQVQSPDWMEGRNRMGLEQFLPGTQDGLAGNGIVVDDVEFATLYPTVWMFMVSVTGPDGKSRKPSSLLVFLEGGSVKARLAERTMGLDLWATAPTVSGVLAALESRLQERPVDWRKAQSGGGGRR